MTPSRRVRVCCAVFLTTMAMSAFAVVPAMAHHAFASEFDANDPVKVTGKVTEMKWANPHAWIFIDVTGPDGKVVNWAFETGGVNALYRRGWRKPDLAVGTLLVIDGWRGRAKNGPPTANAYSITFQDGHRLFAGSSGGGIAPGGGKSEDKE